MKIGLSNFSFFIPRRSFNLNYLILCGGISVRFNNIYLIIFQESKLILKFFPNYLPKPKLLVLSVKNTLSSFVCDLYTVQLFCS